MFPCPGVTSWKQGFSGKEKIMGKAHETAKENRKHPLHTQKEKRESKRARKEPPGSLPFMGNHYKTEAEAPR